MRYRIEHLTAYAYGQGVSISHHAARLRPLHNAYQQVADFQMKVSPRPDKLSQKRDYFGNTVDFFMIQDLHSRLEVTTVSHVTVSSETTPYLNASFPWESVRDQVKRERTEECLHAYEFCFPSRHVPVKEAFREYAAPSFPPGRPLLEAAMDLTTRIHTDFKFDPKATTISTPPMEVLEKRKGVCQDFAHLQISCLRSLGLPARYVSGYVRTEPPPGQPRLLGADATHAWVAVFCPGLGWTEYDPTNDVIPTNGHIRVAYGRDYSDISPLRGTVVGGGSQRLTIGVTVEPLDDETPAPAQPEATPAAPAQTQVQIQSQTQTSQTQTAVSSAPAPAPPQKQD